RKKITGGESSLDNEATFRRMLPEFYRLYMFLERMNTVNKKFCSDTAFKSFRPSIVAIVKLLAEQLEATGATKRRLDFLNFMINHPIVSIHHDEILGWGSTKASGALENERDGNS